MNAATPYVVEYEAIRDLRHLAARAAGDLADWLVHLELEGKADRTIDGYARAVAPLLRAHLDKTVAEFTHTDINDQLRLVPRRSRYINRSMGHESSATTEKYYGRVTDLEVAQKVAAL